MVWLRKVEMCAEKAVRLSGAIFVADTPSRRCFDLRTLMERPRTAVFEVVACCAVYSDNYLCILLELDVHVGEAFRWNFGLLHP